MEKHVCEVREHINENARYPLHQSDASIIPRLANYTDNAWHQAAQDPRFRYAQDIVQKDYEAVIR